MQAPHGLSRLKAKTNHMLLGVSKAKLMPLSSCP